MSSTPVRRKDLRRVSFANSSIINFSPLRKSTPGLPNPVVLLNVTDDEAERLQRRNVVEIHRRISTSLSVSSPLNEINSLVDENQVKDHLKICTKLYTENKISNKNAWELHIIDVIRRILKNDSDNVLQVAGSSLDIGTKVYACRVDDLHCKGLKLASYWSKNKENIQSEQNDETEAVDINKTVDTQTNKKTATRKRKKLIGDKSTIDKDGKTLFAPPKLLEPILFSTNENIDVSSTDNLFTYKLHVNPADQLFTLLTDQKYWTTNADVTLQIGDQPIEIEFPDISQSKLCESFKDFEIGDWDPEVEENRLLENGNVILDDDGLPMPDLDGSIHNIFDNGTDDPSVDSGSEVEEQCKEFQARIHGEVAHLVDSIPEENRIETDYGYNSYIKTSSGQYFHRIWGGPSHWKIKYVRPSVVRYSGTTEQKVAKYHKKRKVFKPIDFNVKPKDVPSKNFVNGRTPITTSFEKITLPAPDLLFANYHNTICDFLTRPSVRVLKRNNVHQQNQEIEVSAYNYENPNDSHYCSQHNSDEGNGADMNNASFEEEGAGAASENFLNNHLVNEPEMVTVDHLTYALQAKKMDMKKLKTAIWKKLTQDANAAEKAPVIQPMKFAQLYKELPDMLNADMRKELSCHLTFAALLHLCNENNLKLSQSSNDTFKDFTIHKVYEIN